MQRIALWDLPTRAFHWLLAASVTGALVTGYVGGNWIEWHARLGETIVGLIVFRIVWGFVGAPSAQFTTFVRGPRAIAAYVRGQWQGVGHNPLGGWSVILMLLALLVQATTGLFTNDEIATTGPLVQAWFARSFPHGTVYRLFALSNLASMLALISYPFVFETWVATALQAKAWSAGYALFVALCAASALVSLRGGAANAITECAVGDRSPGQAIGHGDCVGSGRMAEHLVSE